MYALIAFTPIVLVIVLMNMLVIEDPHEGGKLK